MSENMGRPREKPLGPAFDREVGGRIAAARENTNLSKTELGVKIKKSLATVSRYESGDLPIPTQTLAKIAKITGTKICDFVDGIKLK